LKPGSTFQTALMRVTGWVHTSAKGSPLDRARREFFILSRLATSAFAGLLVAPFLALNSPLHAWAPLALIWVLAPLAAVAWLVRGGSLAQARFVWQAGLLALAAIIAFAAGFAHGAALICLLLIPLEAAVSEALPVQLLASGAAATFMLIMFGAQYGGLLSGAEGYSGVATEALSAGMTLDGNFLWAGIAGTNTVDKLDLTAGTDTVQVATSFKKSDNTAAPPNLVVIKPK